MIEPEFDNYMGDDYATIQPPPPPSIQYTNPLMLPVPPPNEISNNKCSEEKKGCPGGKIKNLPLVDESQMPKVKRGRRRRFVVDPKEEIKAIKEKRTKGNSTANKRKNSNPRGNRNSGEDSECNGSEASDDDDDDNDDDYDDKDTGDCNDVGNDIEMTVEGNNPGNAKKNVRESIKKKRNREAAQQFRLRQKIYIKGLEEKLKQGEATQRNLADEIKRSEEINNELKTQISESQNFLMTLVPLIRWNYESMFSVDSQDMNIEQQQYGFPMSAFEGGDANNTEESINK